MANGETVKLSNEEVSELKRKIATFPTRAAFCKSNMILSPLLTYPLNIKRCSKKTYEKIKAAKTKAEIDSATIQTAI